MKRRYVVTLTDEERRSLRALASSGKGERVPHLSLLRMVGDPRLFEMSSADQSVR